MTRLFFIRPCPSEIFAIAILLSIAIVPKLSAGTEKVQIIGPRIAILTIVFGTENGRHRTFESDFRFNQSTNQTSSKKIVAAEV